MVSVDAAAAFLPPLLKAFNYSPSVPSPQIASLRKRRNLGSMGGRRKDESMMVFGVRYLMRKSFHGSEMGRGGREKPLRVIWKQCLC